jgi:hypothetical protein
MYPKWTFPEKRRKVPKSRKKSTGPARSESSIMCWSIRARGLRTANVCFVHTLAPILPRRLYRCFSGWNGRVYLALNMRKVHSKFL